MEMKSIKHFESLVLLKSLLARRLRVINIEARTVLCGRSGCVDLRPVCLDSDHEGKLLSADGGGGGGSVGLRQETAAEPVVGGGVRCGAAAALHDQQVVLGAGAPHHGGRGGGLPGQLEPGGGDLGVGDGAVALLGPDADGVVLVGEMCPAGVVVGRDEAGGAGEPLQAVGRGSPLRCTAGQTDS